MQNGMIDLYVRGNNSVAYSEIYSSFASEKNSYISDLLLLVINNDSSKVRKHGETYFTIRMGNREATQYYTKSENTSAIQSKARYDSKYEHITSTGYQLMYYEPGSVFKLNGKEYVLSENHTLDIPYGEDLWCLEYPSNYRFCEKID